MIKTPGELTADPAANIVLMVEPDVLVRLVIADYLRACGYKVIEAVTAAEALAVLNTGHEVHIVFAEVKLPGAVDGFTLASRIRSTHPTIDVVLTTGVSNTANKAAELCDDGPLEKPYEPAEVARRIGLLRQRRKPAP